MIQWTTGVANSETGTVNAASRHAQEGAGKTGDEVGSLLTLDDARPTDQSRQPDWRSSPLWAPSGTQEKKQPTINIDINQ